MRIVVDVMGGDHGCGVVVEGAKMALEGNSQIQQLFLVGNESEIKAAIATKGLTDQRITIVHASQVLTMEDKPVEGLRRKKDCSILRAMDLVKEGRAEAVISTGNTGGLVAAATIRLRTLPGVDRPAIATVIPSEKSAFVLIDAGANPDCKPVHLLQSAIMGSIYSREILGRDRPRVGILSNGTETTKGTDLTREALKLCAEADLNFIGYVEGHHLFSDAVEVVVTDGFVGNIVLKTCESMGKAIVRTLKSELTANPLRKFGAAIAAGAFKGIKKRMDPEAYGGAPLLGLNGNVIKAHGSAREKAIMNAIRVSAQTVTHQINQLIVAEIGKANARIETSRQPLAVGVKT
ncbi:MAG: Phosphate acyltransferase [Verrucomicrobiales bacterium]|nr:Phosphate acyltransferase [Verrucomicrobiales bacterium]